MKLGVMLADCALRYPEREAVICGDRRLTFRTLDERATRLANALVTLGQKMGDRVALYLPNGVELVEGMAAVARTGGVIVPISTRLTAAEVKFILEDCEPRVVVYSPEFRDSAHAAVANLPNATLVAVGEPDAGEHNFEAIVAAAAPDPLPPLPTEVEDLVIGYTSGTTGHPKGAIATHAGVCLLHGFLNAVEWRLTNADRTLVTTPMAHRTGLGRIAGMFCLGSSVVIMPRFDPAEAVSLIEREKVTVIGGVPTIFRMLLPEFQRRPEALKSLHTIGATGETFPVELKRELLSVLPDLRIFSFYAQTEAGFICCLRPEEQLTHPHSVGRPTPGVEIRIVDAELNDVPPGEPGEVMVRCGAPGTIMTLREYFRRPEATAETIVDGWVRTGDLCRQDPDGYVYFVDRAKDMIVSGGLNIYSREVELALEEHADVAEVAVVGVPDPEFGEAVMAFVVRRPGAEPSPDSLIEHCRSLIASYKKPKYVRFIDVLPRNSTGKVQKAELRASAAEAAAPAR